MMSEFPRNRAAVLIIEDEPVQRMMMLDLVEEAGCDAVEANDADHAIRILEDRTDIRIVFADIDMPNGVNGLKLAATMRSRWPPIELILTSGKRDPKVEEIPARGIFLSKPYNISKVIEVVKRFTA